MKTLKQTALQTKEDNNLNTSTYRIRLGVSIDIPNDKLATFKENPKKEFIQAIKNGRVRLDGETYFPPTEENVASDLDEFDFQINSTQLNIVTKESSEADRYMTNFPTSKEISEENNTSTYWARLGALIEMSSDKLDILKENPEEEIINAIKAGRVRLFGRTYFPTIEANEAVCLDEIGFDLFYTLLSIADNDLATKERAVTLTTLQEIIEENKNNEQKRTNDIVAAFASRNNIKLSIGTNDPWFIASPHERYEAIEFGEELIQTLHLLGAHMEPGLEEITQEYRNKAHDFKEMDVTIITAEKKYQGTIEHCILSKLLTLWFNLNDLKEI